MIITVTLNPAIDQTVEVDHFEEGDTNRVLAIRWDIGGKGINVARVLKELDYEPLAMGFAPGDLGRMIEDQLSDSGIGTDFTFVPGETRTNITILDRSQHRHTVLSAPGPVVGEAEQREFFEKIQRRLRPDTWLVVAGSIPPPGDGATYGRLIRAAESQRALSALDADGPLVRELLDGGVRPTLIKLNDHELARVYDDPTRTEDEVIDAAESIRALGVPAVVVTRGGEGAIALTPEADYRVRPPAVEVQSAVGAGDAFLAGLLYGLRRDRDWPRSLALAAASGSACCRTPGTQLCTGREVRALVGEAVVERLGQRTAAVS